MFVITLSSTTTMSKTVPCATYTTSDLKDALASMATKNVSDLNEDCKHIHGFCNDSDASFFKNDHELSMLQTITARRILDYKALLVRSTVGFMKVFMK